MPRRSFPNWTAWRRRQGKMPHRPGWLRHIFCNTCVVLLLYIVFPLPFQTAWQTVSPVQPSGGGTSIPGPHRLPGRQQKRRRDFTSPYTADKRTATFSPLIKNIGGSIMKNRRSYSAVWESVILLHRAGGCCNHLSRPAFFVVLSTLYSFSRGNAIGHLRKRGGVRGKPNVSPASVRRAKRGASSLRPGLLIHPNRGILRS